jgi:hypothetical protein
MREAESLGRPFHLICSHAGNGAHLLPVLQVIPFMVWLGELDYCLEMFNINM